MNGKYLKYAVGEILLIVAGILIALQVNNWNEKRLTDNLAVQYLEQIQNELLIDLESFIDVSRRFERRDSVMEKVLTDQIKEEDYRKNPRLRFLITTTHSATLNRDGYESLIAIIDESSFSNQKLINDLKWLYVDAYDNLEMISKWYLDFVHEYNSYLSVTYTWALDRDPLINQFHEKEISYLTQDRSYKSRVARFRNLAIGNLLSFSQILEQRLAEIFHDISSITKREVPESVNRYIQKPNSATYQKNLGKYVSKNSGRAIELKEENQSLKLVLPLYDTFDVTNGKNGRFFLKGNYSNFIFENDSTMLIQNYSRERFYKTND